jgi:restriction system protein
MKSDPKISGTISLQSQYILIIIISGRNKAAQFNQFLSIILLGHIGILYLNAAEGGLDIDTSPSCGTLDKLYVRRKVQMMVKEKLSRSRELAAKVIYAALQILKEKGGQAPGRDVLTEVEKRVPLDDWAKATYEKSGHIRWQAILHFFSIDCIKAGYLIKKKGVWYLTPEGEGSLAFGEVGLLKSATTAYRKWREENQISSDVTEEQDATEEGQQGQEATIHEIELLAIEGLNKQISSKNPYEFQELVAALLRGMGYYTPFVAPQGKDGGVDVLAYRDPLGTVSPRIKVQIKHRESSASVQEVRQLMGLLQKDGDVGMFVSSGGFTPDAKTTARGSHVHVELLDLDRFIALWQEFYLKLSDEDKSLLPLIPIYFYAPPS